MTGGAAPGALVLAGGEPPQRELLDLAWPGWDAAISIVVAADGGARWAPALGLRLDAWVGDGDSVGADELARLRAADVPVTLVTVDKDESDTELALVEALRLGAASVTILGALGGERFDHALANVMLLAHPALAGRPACLLDARVRVSLLSAPLADGSPARHPLPGPIGGIVSLLPLGERVEGVTTAGLRYPLHDEPLDPGPARGLSNVRDTPDAAVVVRAGRLLVIESAATLTP